MSNLTEHSDKYQVETTTSDRPEDIRSLKALLATWAQEVAGTGFPQPPAYSGPDVILSGLVEHSDDVHAGDCFIARVRTGSDGHPYIFRAVEQGAALVIGQRRPEEVPPLDGVPYLQVADTAVALAWLAAAWHDFPSRQLVMLGVTGTDGKTTTANLLFQILRSAGLPVGLLSTIRAVIGREEEPLALHVTTPEAPVIQRYLRRMVDAGLTHCVLEATSHGLAQHRVDAVEFDLAIVTNITHEHLDYHGDYEGYFAAKARLFTGLNSSLWPTTGRSPAKERLAPTAVLNRDDSSYERLADLCPNRVLTYAVNQPADVTAAAIRYGPDKTHFSLNLPDIPAAAIHSPLAGEFNVYNMLASAAAAWALDIGIETIRDGLEAVGQLSGRMECINAGQPFLVIIDFAHTPNALENAIRAARGMASGRIITVFGSAGKRDVEKRRLMAEVSARLSDISVLTAEDPRTESLDDILAMMASGCERHGRVEGLDFWRIPDRGQAIYHALSLAKPEDLVLICGKGHEQSMCFGTIEYPWDDRQATRTALDAFLAGEPMPNLGLPTFGPLLLSEDSNSFSHK
jgi:UDP-N-acetylmuramoyl-L-alanyl-D-glutamate--2,6-diaminopimelate ligase